MVSGPWWGAAAASLSAAAAAGVALRGLARAPIELAWDGQAWWLDGQPVSASLQLDLAAGLLLRLQSTSGQRWVGISRAEAGAAWHRLRVAVQAHARGDGRVDGALSGSGLAAPTGAGQPWRSL